MRILITGGAGFLGARLARRLLERGTLADAGGAPREIDEVVLFDRVHAAGFEGEPRVRTVAGDIAERAALERWFDGAQLGVFHLASMVSAEAEQDFDRARRVNLDGGLGVLELCRRCATAPRLVFASSVAVFGGAASAGGAGDQVKHTPLSTYGATKAVLELMVNEYTRKGFVDGRSARLPTVIVRPGKPNRAASGFASALFREPLAGQRCVVPVAAGTRIVVAGYRAVVDGMIALYDAPGEALGADRGVSFAGLEVSVEEMIAALRRVAGSRPLGAVDIEPDPEVEAIVASWPANWRAERARRLGLPAAPDLDAIVGDYIEDYG